MFHRSDGHTRVWCSDDETSTSESYSLSYSQLTESLLDKSAPESYEEVTYDSIQQSAYDTNDKSLYDSLPPIAEEDLSASNAAGVSNAAKGRDKLVVRIAAGRACGIDTNVLRIRVGEDIASEANNMDMEVAATKPVAVGRGARGKRNSSHLDSRVEEMDEVMEANNMDMEVAAMKPVAVGRGARGMQNLSHLDAVEEIDKVTEANNIEVAAMKHVAVEEGLVRRNV
jgi:hypothetical protein